MITERAKTGFGQILRDSISDSIKASSDDVCEIEIIKDLKGIEEDEVVVLTISSYLFRVMTFFYVKANRPMREHFARKLSVQGGDMETGAFYDAFAEFGNLCCGAVNRELGHYFPHVGMSTPNVLDKNCINYIGALGAGLVQHFRVVVNQSTTFHASLCVCDYADIDFVLKAASDDATSIGELEMF